jgi:hypothetical protein
MVDELLSRQAILDCLHRYSRGVDRLDGALILSAFHSDAVDYHGREGRSPAEFVDWVCERHRERLGVQHFMTNHTFDFDGDIAYVESYFCVPHRVAGGMHVETVGGRYVDRFERRSGAWKIARRVVVREWSGRLEATPPNVDGHLGVRTRADISYERDGHAT